MADNGRSLSTAGTPVSYRGLSHWMDRAYVQILNVMSTVLRVGGLLLAAVGLLVAVAHLIS